MMETAFLHTEEVRLRAVSRKIWDCWTGWKMMNLCGSMEM